MSEQGARRLRRGDEVLVPAVVRNTWIDADAQRRHDDDGRRCSLRLRSGVLLYTVRVSDVEPIDNTSDEGIGG